LRTLLIAKVYLELITIPKNLCGTEVIEAHRELSNWLYVIPYPSNMLEWGEAYSNPIALETLLECISLITSQDLLDTLQTSSTSLCRVAELLRAANLTQEEQLKLRSIINAHTTKPIDS
jgi:hypothetical protein